jgi:hypothetical protein
MLEIVTTSVVLVVWAFDETGQAGACLVEHHGVGVRVGEPGVEVAVFKKTCPVSSGVLTQLPPSRGAAAASGALSSWIPKASGTAPRSVIHRRAARPGSGSAAGWASSIHTHNQSVDHERLSMLLIDYELRFPRFPGHLDHCAAVDHPPDQLAT